MKLFRHLYILVAFLFVNQILEAQIEDKEVHVISSFKPTIKDADKISQLPVNEDTIQVRPEINYSIMPSRVETEFDLKPIKPATMVGTPLDKLYKSYLKLGLGNYVTPLAEFSIHNLRSKDYAVGGYWFHKSSYTNLKLENGHEVPAGYGTNRASVYGKRFYKNINVEGNVDFNSDRLRHYGYNVNNFPDSIPPMDKEDIKQSFVDIGANVSVLSIDTDSTQPSYKVTVAGNYLYDHFANNEGQFNIGGSLKIPIKSFSLGIDANYDIYSKSESISAFNNSVLTLRPYFSKSSREWQVSVGAKLVNDQSENSDFHFYPEARIRFRVINDLLVTYFSVSGDKEINSYKKISRENLYIIPGLNVKNSNHTFMANGGVEGRISSKAGYRADVSFTSVNDAYFFVNDTTDLNGLQNQFDVVYDNIDLIKYYGELYYYPYNYLGFFLKTNIYDYKMTKLAHAWHKPSYDLTFSANYVFKEKIIAQVDLMNYGTRNAFDLTESTGQKELKPVWDLNLRLEYKYSNILSAFVDVYNLLSQDYYNWNYYPSQRINILLGITYKL